MAAIDGEPWVVPPESWNDPSARMVASYRFPMRGRTNVIVSNDAADTTAARLDHEVLTVVPVTTNVACVYPFQVLLPAVECGLGRDSKAQAEQVRSVAVERVGERAGRLSPVPLVRLDRALRLHLDL